MSQPTSSQKRDGLLAFDHSNGIAVDERPAKPVREFQRLDLLIELPGQEGKPIGRDAQIESLEEIDDLYEDCTLAALAEGDILQMVRINQNFITVCGEYISGGFGIFKKRLQDMLAVMDTTRRVCRRELLRRALLASEDQREEILARLRQHAQFDQELAIVREALANGRSIFADLKRTERH